MSCQYNTTSTLKLTDSFLAWLGGCDKQLATINTLFKASWASPLFPATVTTPANGFTLTIPSDSNNSWQLLRPATTLATGTITLPLNTDAADGQEILFTCSTIISALTTNLNGALSADGMPTVLAAFDSFTIRYNKITNIWYKVA